MDDRVYILLDVVGGKAEQVARLLRESRGVVMADVIEGPPDVIMLVKAAERQQLAKLAIQALTSVETMTENFLLLPARDRSGTNTYPKSSYSKRKKVI